MMELDPNFMEDKATTLGAVPGVFVGHEDAGLGYQFHES